MFDKFNSSLLKLQSNLNANSIVFNIFVCNDQKFNPPGAVGVSLALEKILLHCPVDIKPSRCSLNALIISLRLIDFSL